MDRQKASLASDLLQRIEGLERVREQLSNGQEISIQDFEDNEQWRAVNTAMDEAKKKAGLAKIGALIGKVEQDLAQL